MSVSTQIRLFSAVVLAALFTSTYTYAQAVYGSIYGTVTDASGAVVPGATVTVEDVAKGTSSTVTSNGSGEFAADHLIPDVYNVKVTAQGFQSYQQTGITVLADTSTKAQIVLQVGASETTVEVNADNVPQLKTDRADVSTSFVSREIQDLPVSGTQFHRTATPAAWCTGDGLEPCCEREPAGQQTDHGRRAGIRWNSL